MFQRRHFEKVAYVLRHHQDCPEVVESFCRLFEQLNPNFNRERFEMACKEDCPQVEKLSG